jgi:hypothetical protein
MIAEHRRQSGRWVAAAMICCAMQLSAEPLPTTNQNPFLASIGLPQPLPAELRVDHTQLGAALNWGSTSVVQTQGRELLILDAETRELRITFTHAIDDRLAVRAELPYLYTGAGFLDSFIDGFHDTFSLEEGDRPLFARDQVLARYQRSGPAFVNERDSTQGIGDLTLGIGTRLIRTDAGSLMAWFNLDVPSGSSDAHVVADDAWNGTLSLSGQYRLGNRWLGFAQASATAHTGDGLFDDQQPVIWSGFAGIEFAMTPALSLLLQAQAHSAPVENTQAKILGSAVVLTVGGRIHTRNDLTVHVGLSEDIKVEASPDVVFVFGVTQRW